MCFLFLFNELLMHRFSPTYLRLSSLACLCAPLFLWMIFSGCSREEEVRIFERLPSSQTGITFRNDLFPTEEFNMYIFRNFYNGGGVAAGDLTGNGLPDLFFTGNMTSNRLYKNLGDYRFEDITEQAGLLSDGSWSTGVSLADVNGNGRLDIFITKSGPEEGSRRHNELFINNGDGTFTESAEEWGIADIGLSTHGVFFDYNGSGLPDLYVINNSFHSLEDFAGVTAEQRLISDPEGGSKLYRNEGGTFTDVTREARIFDSAIGFGLSAVAADINHNGLPDLYVANDFFERDYLYINNGDGTFTESLEELLPSISFSSMGTDIADLTNNGRPDIYVTDMLPEDQHRRRSKMTIETRDEYLRNAERGFHHKYTRNALQLNAGGDRFSEAGRLTGTHSTDWSWAALIADFDLNGHSDIFVANGIYKDLLDQDYLEFVANPQRIRDMIRSGEENVIMKLLDEMNSQPLQNYLFANTGQLQFENTATDWGMYEAGFSTGAAWADLNGNGLLDLVISNVHDEPWIFRNRTDELHPERTWLRIDLEGEAPNTQALGAKAYVYAGDGFWYREHSLQRGFQSSVEPGLFFGLGETSRIDSLLVRWPDGRVSKRTGVEVSQRITLKQSDAGNHPFPLQPEAVFPGDAVYSGMPGFQSDEVRQPVLNDAAHQAYDHNDFSREQLMFWKTSVEGPALCSGDIHGYGFQSVYIGGAREQSGRLFAPDDEQLFSSIHQTLFEQHASSEDIACHFFDATGNGLDDLYVVSGGNSFSGMSSALRDRLYLNKGNGNLEFSGQILPGTTGFSSGSAVVSNDFTGNGHADLFVGGRMRPFAYGIPPRSFLLEGDGTGAFRDITEAWAPELLEAGMVTSAVVADLTGNGEKELAITGRWMPVRVFENTGSSLREITQELGLSETTGLWNALIAADVTGNGRTDLVGGNHGLNTMFRASPEKPLRMTVTDLGQNGLIDQLISLPDKSGTYYPKALRHEFMDAAPSFRETFPTYDSFAAASDQELLSGRDREQMLVLEARMTATTAFLNRGDGRFEAISLPLQTQLSPVFGLAAADLNGNGRPEIITGGNLYGVKPQTGKYDASRPAVVWYDVEADSFFTQPYRNTGLEADGEIRNIITLKLNGEAALPHLLFSRYNSAPLIFSPRAVSFEDE